jgi:antitoxin component of RelBE/YafQ-DinJ toxin-antitoxin module
MNNVLLSIKTDPETKRQLKDFAAELGVSSTAFVNMVIKQAIRDRRVVLSSTLEPTPHLEDMMRKANADYAAGRNIITTKTDNETLDLLGSL